MTAMVAIGGGEDGEDDDGKVVIINDTKLPDFSFNVDRKEIAFNWVGMFTNLFAVELGTVPRTRVFEWHPPSDWHHCWNRCPTRREKLLWGCSPIETSRRTSHYLLLRRRQQN